MQSQIEIYLANAAQCEARAQEMPSALRRELLVLAEEWRKLADAAVADDAAEREKKSKKVS